MEDLIITCKEHKVLKKFQKRLESRYNVKIHMPDEVTSSESDVVFTSIYGEKLNIERVKKFLLEKMSMPDKRDECKQSVTVITLSDSDEEPTSCITPEERSISIVENSPRFDMLTVCHESREDSVYVIENSVIPESTLSISNHKTKYKDESEKCRNSKMKNEKVRSKGILPSSATFEDAELCEVTSTTEEVVSKKPKLCEEFICLLEEPVKTERSAEFIPLRKQRKSRFESSCDNSPRKNKRYRSNRRSCDNLTKKNDRNDDVVVLKEEPLSALRPLRPIVIDGCNVAMEHGQVSHTFSVKGIKLAIDYFLDRGHTQVTAFVPKFRRFHNPHHNFPTTDPEMLNELAKKQLVVFTPSRRLNGKCIASYDDRFIVQLASTNGGIIVSNDNYRDLVSESESFKEAIEKRLLMFCFVGDTFMVPDDPLGREGPSLAEYLCFPPDTNKT